VQSEWPRGERGAGRQLALEREPRPALVLAVELIQIAIQVAPPVSDLKQRWLMPRRLRFQE
jgi:hypothetical protein